MIERNGEEEDNTKVVTKRIQVSVRVVAGKRHTYASTAKTQLTREAKRQGYDGVRDITNGRLRCKENNSCTGTASGVAYKTVTVEEEEE